MRIGCEKPSLYLSMDMEYDMFEVLSQEAKEIIEECVGNPDRCQEIQSIINYQRTRLEDVIDKKLLKTIKLSKITTKRS